MCVYIYISLCVCVCVCRKLRGEETESRYRWRRRGGALEWDAMDSEDARLCVYMWVGRGRSVQTKKLDMGMWCTYVCIVW